MTQTLKSLLPIWTTIFAVLLLAGCTTSKINWDSRVGDYTYDQAVLEMGPPERMAKLSDDRTVAEWLTFRGHSGGQHHYSPYFYSPFYSPHFGGSSFYSDPAFPDQFVRLTFSPEGRLEHWKKVTK